MSGGQPMAGCATARAAIGRPDAGTGRESLEETMQRHNVETNATAKAFQASGLALLLVIAAMLAHTVIYGDRTLTAAAKAPQPDAGYLYDDGDRLFY
jgi:hypothetical protein